MSPERLASAFETHRPGLLLVARRYVSVHEAEDVVQDAWVAAMEGIERFEGRSSLRVWLAAIVANRARSLWVHERRSVPMPVEELPPARVAPPPEQELAVHDLRSRLLHAVASLSAPLRAVIELRDLRGWSAQETCAQLGIDDGTQRVRLHRARLQVRAALQESY